MSRRLARTLAATLSVAALSVAFAGAAEAQTYKGKSAGDVLVRLRGIGVVPDGENAVKTAAGAATPFKTDVDNSYVPEVDLSYFLTENVAMELIAATTKHNVKAKGAGTEVGLGSVWLLPPTVTLQYHFMPKAQISPYVGAGLNYTLFYGVDSGSASSISYDNKVGYALQAGVDVDLGNSWSFNVDVKRLWLKTDVDVRLGATALKSTVELDPWIVGVGVGYRF